MYNHFKKLYIIKVAERYGKDPVYALNLKPNQTFLVNKYKVQAKFFKEAEIRGIIDDMIKLDTNYKLRSNRCKYWSSNYSLQLL